jgi:hypothetical protein
MHKVDGPDDVPMTTVIEEAHQNGTLSVSTMYRRFRIPRGTRLMRNPPRLLALASALALLLKEPWNMKANPSPAGLFLRFITPPQEAAPSLYTPRRAIEGGSQTPPPLH